MQKSVTWFCLFIKKQCRQWETWAVCGCMVLCLVFVSMIQKPVKDNLSIAFYVCDEDALSLRMKTILLSAESIFDFYETDSKKKLQSEIQSGNAFCGFVIEEGFEDRIKQGEQKECITYFCLRETVRGRVAKETVYAEFLKLFSEQLINIYGADFGGKDAAEFLAESLENNRLYLEGDELFQVDYVEMDEKEKQDENNSFDAGTYPVEGLFITFLFLGVLLVNAENRSKSGKYLLQLMSPVDCIRFKIGQYLAIGCIIGSVGVCCLLVVNRELSWKTQFIGLPGAVLLCIVWSFFADRLFSKEITYQVWLVTILLFHVLISPVFFRIDDYLPVLEWVQWLSPVGFYLHVVEGLMI